MAEKPYLAAAFLCERVLQEKDGVLSAIRIIDTYSVSIPKNLPEDAKATIQITALLAFKKASPGTEAEKHQITLQLFAPSGPQPPQSIDVFFNQQAELDGFNLITGMSVAVAEFGLFWLHVFIDGEPATRIPFRLLLKEEETPKMIH